MRRVDLPEDGFDLGVPHVRAGLAGRFLIPPFSVFRAYSGEWQRRKKQWLSLGIKSEVGRLGEYSGVSLRPGGGGNHAGREFSDSYRGGDAWAGKKAFSTEGVLTDITGTSVFDPALCEVLYSWFCPLGGQVVDPFAGGSVRGIVASCLGLRYWGCDIRQEQIDSNIEQAHEIVPDAMPEWVCGDALREVVHAPEADFILSCPPYGNLEVYSDLPGELSAIPVYDDFLSAYRRIVRRALRRLKQDRFACFVVANFRDEHGFYHDFVGDTVRAFEDSGVRLYNEIVFVTPMGTLPLRAGRYFVTSRKVGKAHQNVLVFWKGDPKMIKQVFGEREES